MSSSEYIKEKYREWKISAPAVHTVLGSGLSDELEKVKLQDWMLVGEISFQEIPDFVKASVQGHPGLYKFYKNKNNKVISLQLGRLHGYEGHSPQKVVQSVTQIKDAGTETFILTNAAGSLQKHIAPSSVMIIDDQVNLTGQNPLIGKNPVSQNGQELGPRFPDMSAVYDKILSKKVATLLEKNFQVHHGTYLGILGPSFETPAEIKLFSQWGLGAVGMSTVWEAIALKHRGAKLLGLSMICNYGCGLMGDEILDHKDVLAKGKQNAQKLLQTLFDFYGEII